MCRLTQTPKWSTKKMVDLVCTTMKPACNNDELSFMALIKLTNINILIMYYFHYFTCDLFMESRVEKISMN